MKNKRVPTNYAVTRKMKRYIAKLKMKQEGKEKICKHSYMTMKRGNYSFQNKVPSYFAEHWKEYTEEVV